MLTMAWYQILLLAAGITIVQWAAALIVILLVLRVISRKINKKIEGVKKSVNDIQNAGKRGNTNNNE